MTVAHLIATRLAELGLKPSQLRAELARSGLRVSRQAVHAWITGRERPSPGNILALWNVLLIPLDQRAGWMEALAQPRQPDAENRPVEAT